jgi:hypothetical protein
MFNPSWASSFGTNLSGLAGTGTGLASGFAGAAAAPAAAGAAGAAGAAAGGLGAAGPLSMLGGPLGLAAAGVGLVGGLLSETLKRKSSKCEQWHMTGLEASDDQAFNLCFQTCVSRFKSVGCRIKKELQVHAYCT